MQIWLTAGANLVSKDMVYLKLLQNRLILKIK